MLTEDLRVVARQAMIEAGFSPDSTPEMNAELREIGKHPDNGADLRDMRKLLCRRSTTTTHAIWISSSTLKRWATGTFVRVVDPPVEGMLLRGEQGVDVGEEIEVELLSTNIQHGFIDFGRVGSTPTPNPPGKER